MSPARHPVRALVLAPTRELADQVAENVKKYAKHSNLRSVVVFGGIDMKPQTLALKAGVEVLIATPGRLLDHIEAKNAVLNQVEYVVLDEADRMLDIGFPARPAAHPVLPAQGTPDTAAFQRHLLAGNQEAWRQQLPAEPGTGGGGAPQRHGQHRGAALLQHHRRRQARRRSARLLKQRELDPGHRFRQFSKLGAARLARSFERDGLKHAGIARRQEPGRTIEGAGRLQGR